MTNEERMAIAELLRDIVRSELRREELKRLYEYVDARATSERSMEPDGIKLHMDLMLSTYDLYKARFPETVADALAAHVADRFRREIQRKIQEARR